MEFQGALEVIKVLSEVTSPLLIVVFVIYSLYFKHKGQDVINAEKLGILQSEQLKILIEQNTKLGIELHSVREELSDAYTIINDMRNRIRELEQVLGVKEPSIFLVPKEI